MAITQQLAASPPAQAFHFAGFTWPTYTPIPDQLIDELLPVLTGAELKVTLYICRRTLGFHKVSDNISLNQLLHGIVKKNGERLDAGTGLSKPTLLAALHSLQAKGIVATVRRSSRDHGDEATNYRLCFAEGSQPPIAQPRPPTPTPTPAPAEPVGWRQPDYTPRGEKSLPEGCTKIFTTPLVKKAASQERAGQETAAQETVVHIIDQGSNNNSGGRAVGGGVAEISDFSFSPANETPIRKTTPTDTVHSSVTRSSPPNSDAPPSPTLERQQTGARALIAVGMTTKVAERLAERYSLVQIEEKLGYLDFLQAHEPDKVKNPCGWLRKAIEDDFAAPDGYHSPADEAAQLAAMLALAKQLLECDAPPPEGDTTALVVQQRQAQYGTTDEDRSVWQQTIRELVHLGQAYICDLLTDTSILHCTADTALIGVSDAFQLQQLTASETQLVISRTLTQVAGRVLVAAFAPLQA